MTNLNMIYNKMGSVKSLSTTMLKNYMGGGLYLLTANNNRILFFRQHDTFVLSFFISKTKCVYNSCYYRSMLKE